MDLRFSNVGPSLRDCPFSRGTGSGCFTANCLRKKPERGNGFDWAGIGGHVAGLILGSDDSASHWWGGENLPVGPELTAWMGRPLVLPDIPIRLQLLSLANSRQKRPLAV